MLARRTLPIALALLAAGACSPPAPQQAADKAEPAASRPEARLLTPAPRGEAPATRPSGAGMSALQFDFPKSWRSSPPSSSMRIAQAEIPGAAGPAELAIFHFGPGQGGSVEANLERWMAQIEPKPGSSPSRDSFEVGPLRVTWIEAVGTLLPSGTGMGPGEPKPDSRLLGAVVEGRGGPWFFKATGPAATLDSARADFLAMLHGLRLADGSA